MSKKISFQRVILVIPLLAMVFSASQNAISYAISANDLNSIYQNTPFYDPKANNCNNANARTDELNGYTVPNENGTVSIEPALDAQGNNSLGQPVGFINAYNNVPESLRPAYRNYYIAMRWNYASWNWDGSPVITDQAQHDWMDAKTPHLILVTNPANGKSVVVAALEAGPAPFTYIDQTPNNTPKQGWNNPQQGTPGSYLGPIAGLSQPALDLIKAKPGVKSPGGGTTVPDTQTLGDNLLFAWADQTALPGPTSDAIDPTLDTSNSDCVTSGSTGNVVFVSQRDKAWDNTILCYGAGKDRTCFNTHDEGCWAASVAMIIGTFKNPQQRITPMQTEGGGSPHESFESNNLNDTGYLDINVGNVNRAIAAIRAGGLVLIQGHYGPPWYSNSPHHFEVMRGITDDGQNFYANDPWDLPDEENPNQPSHKTGPILYDGRYQTTWAHSYTAWPISDLYAHGINLRIITKKDTGPGV